MLSEFQRINSLPYQSKIPKAFKTLCTFEIILKKSCFSFLVMVKVSTFLVTSLRRSSMQSYPIHFQKISSLTCRFLLSLIIFIERNKSLSFVFFAFAQVWLINCWPFSIYGIEKFVFLALLFGNFSLKKVSQNFSMLWDIFFYQLSLSQ